MVMYEKFRNRTRKVKVPVESLRGRQGRTIFAEMVDEYPPLPTMFEQSCPFDDDWPKIDVAIEPVGEKDDEFVELAPLDDDDVRPPTDEELVEFWSGMAEQHETAKKLPKRGPHGRFVKSAE
jgi:hypothetical protein